MTACSPILSSAVGNDKGATEVAPHHSHQTALEGATGSGTATRTALDLDFLVVIAAE